MTTPYPPTLRPTRPDDLPRIHQLVDTIYHDYGCWLDLELEPHWVAPGPYFRKSGGEFWVLVRDGRVLGTVAAYLHPDNSAELKCLYIHYDLRRQGWAQYLVDVVEDYARNAGKTRLILWSDVRFVEAHQLYQKLGYTQDGYKDWQDEQNTREYGFWRWL
jgi:GNAT superfamily N-acetyltransferase